MAISSETSSVSYAGNNSTSTAYTLAFPFSGAAELVVTHTTAAGVRATLAITTGYTLHGDYASGAGTLKTVAAIPAADTLLIERFTAATQSLDSSSPAGSYPTSIETQLDRTTRAVQDNKRIATRNLARSLRLPDGETAAELPSAANRKGEIPYFNATTGYVETKTPLEIFVLADSEISADVAVAQAAAAAAAAAKTAAEIAEIAAETARDAAEAFADEAAAAIGIVHNVKNFGAVGNAKSTKLADMTSGSAILGTTGYAGFTAGDVGKRIIVYGAGAAGLPLETTIAAYTSATQVTLSATASTTVANSAAVWGTDDSAAFAAAITAAKASTLTRTVYVPVGQYLANVVLNEPNMQLIGTSSRQGFYQPSDAENNQAGKLGSVIFAADPDEPVISMPSAGTGNAYGSRIQDLQLCGFLKTGFGLEIGDREFAATGYPGHSWTIHNVNFLGFKYAMTIASAGSATVTNCSATECEFGFHVAEVPFLSSNGISDNVVFTSCVTTYTDYSFVVAASKNTVIQSGDFNFPITWVTVVNNGTVNVIGANVEYASTSVVDIQTGGKFIANHVQVLGDFKIRNYSVTGNELVDVKSTSTLLIYMTAGLEYPARIAGGFVARYANTTWATRTRLEPTSDFGMSDMQKSERRRQFLGPENWTQIAASPYGDWNWLLTQIGGGLAVRASTLSADGFELYSTSTGTGNSGRLAMGRAIRFLTSSQKFRIPMRVVGMSTAIFRVGLYSLDGTVDLLPDHGIGIKVDTTGGLDTTIKFEFRNGATVTEVDTTIPVSNANYYWLNIEKTFSGFACVLTNFATNVPLAPQVHLVCAPAAAFVAPAIFAGVSAAAYTQIHIYPGAIIEDVSQFVWVAP